MMEYSLLDHGEQILMKFSWTFLTIVFHENALENVVQKMAAIVSQPQRARLIYGNKKRLVFGADYAYIFL